MCGHGHHSGGKGGDVAGSSWSWGAGAMAQGRTFFVLGKLPGAVPGREYPTGWNWAPWSGVALVASATEHASNRVDSMRPTQRVN